MLKIKDTPNTTTLIPKFSKKNPIRAISSNTNNQAMEKE